MLLNKRFFCASGFEMLVDTILLTCKKVRQVRKNLKNCKLGQFWENTGKIKISDKSQAKAKVDERVYGAAKLFICIMV